MTGVGCSLKARQARGKGIRQEKAAYATVALQGEDTTGNAGLSGAWRQCDCLLSVFKITAVALNKRQLGSFTN
ncbi:hypothetical protein E2C01_084193 [Portunus trituberculatus]|uniref:Uncharacterized protein n=1 Tax=Portunus trituberculatus TaxID=210409 RepID=A0A5B7J5N2_PORTR|nr:hypothetical protein [Portunus trituberculatus]